MSVRTTRREWSRPGSWVAIPLPKGGWGLGLIARRAESRRKFRTVFIYIYGPVPTDSVVAMKLLGRLRPDERAGWGFTTDQAVLEGRWPLLVHLENFDSSEWQLPLVVSGPVGGGQGYFNRREISEYDEKLTSQRELGIQFVNDLSQYAPSGHHGYISFENFAEQAIERNVSLKDRA